MKSNKQKRILAVASAGGHWVQLLRLRPAFEAFNVEYISTLDYDESELNGKLHIVTDANISEKMKAIIMFFQVFWVLIKARPNFIITTGALPGLATILLGKLFFIKTIWVDSIANSEQLSLSGKAAKYFATVRLTQWPGLSHTDGPAYWGNVL
ncbi:MAG: hypothetical protein V3U89_00655 [Methylophilaceae bacterium]